MECPGCGTPVGRERGLPSEVELGGVTKKGHGGIRSVWRGLPGGWRGSLAGLFTTGPAFKEEAETSEKWSFSSLFAVFLSVITLKV